MTDDLIVLYEAVRSDLERDDPRKAVERLEEVTPSDVADLFRSLEGDERIALVRAMPAERAAEVLAEIDDRSLVEVLEILQDDEIVGMLDTLPSDDAADLVGYMDTDDQDRLIQLLREVDHQDAVELQELLRYPEDTAGGVMAKEYLAARRDQSVGTVQHLVRKLPDEELASMHFCFVVDEAGRLVGQVGLLKLMLSPTEKPLHEVMEPDPLVAHVSDDQEEVANLFLWHDLLSLPIVDAGHRLVGRVTVDDAMDVLTEEATEDVARLAGSSAEEFGETSVWRISRARLPWLMLGLVGQLFAALIMSGFEESLRARVILTFFIPMVMATGGNTGIQTSSIMIRALVTHEFDRIRAGRHLARELGVSLLLGAVLGGLMVGVLTLWKQDPTVGVIIGVSLMTVVVMSAMVGSLVPLLCARIDVDPTLATGPFITTTNDVLGLMAYLWIAHSLLQGG
ncbi:MAG TPA: magnesium transporter [Candidatus Krumholzibacteria bacterium]|nr:magnesium transporter [Candidatus Krumholzibacteria bacterium]